MKNLSFLIVVAALAVGIVACGKKEKGASSIPYFSADPLVVSTVRGYIIPKGRYFVVIASPTSTLTYNISQQADAEIQRAFSATPNAQPKPIPYNPANGQVQPDLQSGYLADLTGSVVAAQVVNGIQSGYMPAPQQQGPNGTINVSRALIHP